MDTHFDKNEARKFLESRESHDKEKQELERQTILAKVIDTLNSIFDNTEVEIFLVGSIIQPFKFHPNSDVDVVVRNFNGDRFELWTKLESIIKRDVEVILFENCHFQEHVLKSGHKVR